MSESVRIYHSRSQGSHLHPEMQTVPLGDALTQDGQDHVTFQKILDDLGRSRLSSEVHISEPLRDNIRVQDGIYQKYRNTSHGQTSSLGMSYPELCSDFWLQNDENRRMT